MFIPSQDARLLERCSVTFPESDALSKDSYDLRGLIVDKVPSTVGSPVRFCLSMFHMMRGGIRAWLCIFATIFSVVLTVALILTWTFWDWQSMNRITGVDQCEFPAYLGSSRKTINQHGAVYSQLHDLMGASSLMLGFPIFLFLSMYCTDTVGVRGQVGLALTICVYEVNVAIWSYLGDYYISLVDECTPAVGTKPVDGCVVWWQKVLICNEIDIVFATINGWGLALLGLLQVFLSAGRWSISFRIAIVLLFAACLIIKHRACLLFIAYDSGDHCGETLWWAMFLHSMWHVGGVLLSHWLVYDLMFNGTSYTPVTNGDEIEHTIDDKEVADDACLV